MAAYVKGTDGLWRMCNGAGVLVFSSEDTYDKPSLFTYCVLTLTEGA